MAGREALAGEMIAALPMYDWPEARGAVDAEWAALRDRLRKAGIAAPERLVRRNADMPPVPGGIRDGTGRLIAPDPAMLPPGELDLQSLWRHPALFLAQTCWGPMETTGLAAHVRVVGQPDYTRFEGGCGKLYSSAIVTRREDTARVAAPADGRAVLPLHLLRGARLACNNPDSMSGLLALERDLQAAGESLSLLSARIETGAHRASARAVAEGRADICAIDCRSWALLCQFAPDLAARLSVAGWTARRPGLPFITALNVDAAAAMRRAIRDLLAA